MRSFRSQTSNIQKQLNSAVRPVIERLEPRQLMADAGTRDWSFGPYAAGDTSLELANPTPVPGTSGLQYAAHGSRDLAVLPDGKILVVADSRKDGDEWATDWGIARYNANGSPDLTFGGGDALISTDFNLGFADHAYAIKLLTNGGFIVAGIAGTPRQPGVLERGGDHFLYAVARYHADGTLDTTFGSKGKAYTRVGTSASVEDVLLLPGGKILVGGGDHLIQYNANGTLDRSFAGDGILRIPADGGFARQADGKIVTFSETHLGPGRVYRINADGTTDTTFGDGGVVTLPEPVIQNDKGPIDPTSVFEESSGAIAIAAGGKVVVSTTVRPQDDDFPALFQFNDDGTLDNTFMQGTWYLADAGHPWTKHGSTSRSLVVQSDGKIIQGAGYIRRVNADGTRDSTWHNEDSESFAVGAGRKMHLAGPYEQLFCTTRQWFPMGIEKLSSDASPYVPRIFRHGAVSIDRDTNIATIEGTEGDDVIRIYDDFMYVGIAVNKPADDGMSMPDDSIVKFIVNGNGGNDLIVFGGGYWERETWIQPAFISGGAGNDTLIGSGANDTINGNSGKDHINGGGGSDRLSGNGGHDHVLGNDGGDRIYGGAQNDTLEGGTGNDRVDGGDSDDLMTGNSGTDSLYGGDGENTIIGGGGNDRAYYVNAADQLLGINSKTTNPDWYVASTQTTAPLLKGLDELLA